MYRYSVGVGGGVWLVGLSTSIAILWHGHSVFLDQTNETVRTVVARWAVMVIDFFVSLWKT